MEVLTEKLLEAFEELNIFYDISQSIGNLYDIKDICDIALTQVAEIVCSEKASISLMDEDREHLTIISCKGFDGKPLGKKVKIKDTLYDDVIKCRKPLLAEELDQKTVSIQKRRRYKTNSFILQPICTLPITVSDEVIGIISLADKLDKQPFTARDIKFLAAITNQTAMAIHNARLVTNLRESFLVTVRSLSAAIDAKDHYTHGHSERVCGHALGIGQTLGISQLELQQLELACLLHEVGKIGIPESVLNKKGKLTSQEMGLMHKHPVKGTDILKNTKLNKFVMTAVRHHHEKYDGKGYPDGLVGEQIPMLARIIAVADSYDAMVSNRPYRSKSSQEWAIMEIKNGTGSNYDPKVVWAFIKWITNQNSR